MSETPAVGAVPVSSRSLGLRSILKLFGGAYKIRPEPIDASQCRDAGRKDEDQFDRYPNEENGNDKEIRATNGEREGEQKAEQSTEHSASNCGPFDPSIVN